MYLITVPLHAYSDSIKQLDKDFHYSLEKNLSVVTQTAPKYTGK